MRCIALHIPFETQFTILTAQIEQTAKFSTEYQQSLNLRTVQGYSVLELAILTEQLGMCRDLLEIPHIDLESINPRTGKSALFYAIECLQEKIASMLLEAGADISHVVRADLASNEAKRIFDKLATTAIWHLKKQTASRNSISPTSSPTKSAEKILMLSAELGNLVHFRAVLAPISFDILIRAIANNRVRILRDCAKKGIDFYQHDDMGRNVLHYAAHYDAQDCLAYLLNRDAFHFDINEEDHNGRSPLLTAAISGAIGSINLLLCKGALYSSSDVLGQNMFNFLSADSERSNLAITPHQYAMLTRYSSFFSSQTLSKIPLPSRPSYSQENMILVFSHYLYLMQRDRSYFFTDGYCAGLTFLFHYFDALLPTFPELTLAACLEEIQRWDGSIAALSRPLTNKALPFTRLEDFLETFFSLVTAMQTVPTLPGLSANQTDHDYKLAILSSRLSIRYALPWVEYRMSAGELTEFFSLASHCPTLRIDIYAYQHASCVFVSKDKALQYYQANLDEGPLGNLSPKQIVRLLTHGHGTLKREGLPHDFLRQGYGLFYIAAFYLEPRETQPLRSSNPDLQTLFTYARLHCLDTYKHLFDNHTLKPVERAHHLLDMAQKTPKEICACLATLATDDLVEFCNLLTTSFRDKPNLVHEADIVDASILALCSIIPEHQHAWQALKKLLQYLVQINTPEKPYYVLDEQRFLSILKKLEDKNHVDEYILFKLCSLMSINNTVCSVTENKHRFFNRRESRLSQKTPGALLLTPPAGQ